jgi:type I restriction enzyme R subunit
MRTNFDFLLKDPQFEPFAGAAVSAERALPISPALCATACRTALEFAVKWVYSVDGSLTKPYEDKLVTLISTGDFKDLIPSGMIAKLDYLRRIGNNATHNPRGVSKDQAVLALQNLHSFLDFVAYCYGTNYVETAFDKLLLEAKPEIAPAPVTPPAAGEVDFQTLLDENFPKRKSLPTSVYAGSNGAIPLSPWI